MDEDKQMEIIGLETIGQVLESDEATWQ